MTDQVPPQVPPQDPQPPVSSPEPTPAEPQGKSGTSPILIIGIVAVIVLLIAVIAYIFLGDAGSSTPTPPEVAVPTPLPEAPKVTALEAINVRSGPGTNYPSYGVAPQGAEGQVIGVSPEGGWWVVQIPTNLVASGQGWVSGQYVQAENTDGVPVITPPEPPPVVEVPPPDPNKPIATALDTINIRSGPGTDYPAYGIAPKGAQGQLVGKSQDGAWWVVQISPSLSPDGTGWVSADWVSVENAGNVPVIEAPPKP
jgi:uncharacterized protein YraI